MRTINAEDSDCWQLMPHWQTLILHSAFCSDRSGSWLA